MGMRGEAASAAGQVVAQKASILTALGLGVAWDSNIAIIGVSLGVLLAAILGALLGVAYGEPIPSRFRMGTVVIVNALIASGCASILPHVPFFAWVKQAPLVAVAMILAFAARWAVPALVEQLPIFLRGRLAGPPQRRRQLDDEGEGND